MPLGIGWGQNVGLRILPLLDFVALRYTCDTCCYVVNKDTCQIIILDMQVN